MPASALSLADLNAAIGRATGGRLAASIQGSAAIRLDGLAPLASAGATDLAFLANPRYHNDALTTRAGAVVLSAASAAQLASAAQALPALVIVDEPYAWFAYAAQLLRPAEPVVPGVASQASVAPSAQVDATACIEPGAFVGARAAIGAGVRIGAGAVVGADAAIGAGSRLHPRAVVLDGCRIGERCIVASGAVIGADGFGFAPLDGRWVKVPQVGAVMIGNDVEIGANTTVDRGTMGDTVIEDGVKLDNQVHVAHNCFLGAHTVIAGCVGIAGSTRIGRACQIGGAAMIGGHISIADGCAIGPATAIFSSITEPGRYTAFFPVMKHREWERAAAIIRNLDDLRDRLRELESLQRQGKQS
jgi:UDP-3-O-[3-hydroxymyristoyl] glucosamine N-acyltransferase